MAKRYSRRPNVPGLTWLAPAERAVLEPIKQLLEIREGRRGNPDVDRFVRAGEIDKITRDAASKTARPTSTDAPDPPTDVEVLAGAWGNRVSWTNAANDDLWAVEVFAATVNDWAKSAQVSTVTIPQGKRGERSQYVHPIEDDILPDHYYWVRSVDYSGNTSRIAPPGETDGLLAPGHDTVGQTIERVIDSLEAPNAPDWDSEKDDYETGQIVEHNDKLWQCYDAPVPAGTEPGTSDGADYWRRTGLLVQGDVDGQPTVGVNGNLMVDGTVMGRAFVGDMVISNVIRSHNYSEDVGGFKLDADNGEAEFNSITLQITGGSGALNLDDGPAEKGADNTQSRLDAGAAIDDAVANGMTLISGGYIQTDLLDVDDIIATGSIIVADDSITSLTDRVADNISETTGRKWAAESGADVTQDALDAGAAIDDAKANGYTLIDGGYINTEILEVDYAIIVGDKPPSDADSTSTVIGAGFVTTGWMADSEDEPNLKIDFDDAQIIVNKDEGLLVESDGGVHVNGGNLTVTYPGKIILEDTYDDYSGEIINAGTGTAAVEGKYHVELRCQETPDDSAPSITIDASGEGYISMLADSTVFYGGIYPNDPGADDCGYSTRPWDWVHTEHIRVRDWLAPDGNEDVSIGDSGERFNTIWCKTVDESSGKDKKKNIVDCDLGLDFLAKLRPKKGRWRSGDDGKTHYWFIADEILELVSKEKIDFGGVSKGEMVKVKDDEDNEKWYSVNDPYIYKDHRKQEERREVLDSHVEYGLKYNEFIPVIVKAIQELSLTIDEMQTEKRGGE